MKRITCSCFMAAVGALLAVRAASAQTRPESWVTEIGAPQYFAVFVEDLERSVAWYRTVFGLDQLGGSMAEDGSWRIENLGSERLLVELIRDSRAREVDRARGFRKVGFQVPDVEKVADRAARATGERPRVLDFPRFGLRIIHIRDPDDNIIQLSSSLRTRESANRGITPIARGGSAPIAGCDSARMNALAPLRGSWQVRSREPDHTPPRERIGTATVNVIAGGCALREELQLGQDYQETRLLAFDDRAGTWQLVIVDSEHGNIVTLRGHAVETGVDFITTHHRADALLVDRVAIRHSRTGWVIRTETASGYGAPWRLIQEITYTRP